MADKKHGPKKSKPTAAANGAGNGKAPERAAEDKHSGKGQSGYEKMTDLSAIEPFVVKDPEAMARNMAHMVEEMGKAAAAWVGPRESGEKADILAGPRHRHRQDLFETVRVLAVRSETGDRGADAPPDQLFRRLVEFHA